MYKLIPKGPGEKIEALDVYYYAPNDHDYGTVPPGFVGFTVGAVVERFKPETMVICARRREYVPNVQQLPLP